MAGVLEEHFWGLCPPEAVAILHNGSKLNN